MKKVLFIIFLLLIFPVNILAEEFAKNAKSAVLMDSASGKILYRKNENEKLAPASMTKIMSMLIIMENIDKGHIKLTDKVEISKNAADMGGSQIFIEVGESYTVDELLKGIAIASGNDAVVAMSEKIAGSEVLFVEMMNKKAKEIGAYNTNFVNAHGLDEDNHYSTAYDMSLIAKELLKYETILNYTSIYEEYLNKNDGSKTWLVNTNKLVRFYSGVDGLKTGFTKNAGYCLTATAKKNNFRLISVVMGEDTSESRSADTVNMLNYGFNTYKLNTIKTKEDILGKIRVEKGKVLSSEIVLLNDVTELLKINEKTENYFFNIKVNIIKAPVNKGDKIGTVEILDEKNNIIDEVDVTVNQDIVKANIIDYFIRNLKTLGSGKILIKN